MKDPYLVQRLRKYNYTPSGTGVDSVVQCDYMGAAEFEFGVIQSSLKQMRAEPKIVLSEVPAEGKRPALAIISLPEERDAIAKWFSEELTGTPRHSLKESTYIQSKYKEAGKGWAKDTVGWWAVNGGDSFRPAKDMSWAVFDDLEVGRAWFKALRSK